MLTRTLRSVADACLFAPRGFWAIVALAWMGGIWLLSSLQTLPGSRSFWFAWLLNCGHAFEFGMLALWLALALPRREHPRPWADLTAARVLLVFVLAMSWAVIDEWHQSQVVGRDATVFDLATDACGILGVLWIARGAGRHAEVERGERGLRVSFAAAFVASALAGLAATLR
jgi:VanZ family protein